MTERASILLLENELLELVKLRASYLNGCEELVHLTMAVVAINAWNRLALALGTDVGTY